MRTELVSPGQIDYLDESARPGTFVVGPFDVLSREVRRDR